MRFSCDEGVELTDVPIRSYHPQTEFALYVGVRSKAQVMFLREANAYVLSIVWRLGLEYLEFAAQGREGLTYR